MCSVLSLCIRNNLLESKHYAKWIEKAKKGTYKLNKHNTCQNTRTFTLKRTSIDTQGNNSYSNIRTAKLNNQLQTRWKKNVEYIWLLFVFRFRLFFFLVISLPFLLISSSKFHFLFFSVLFYFICKCSSRTLPLFMGYMRLFFDCLLTLMYVYISLENVNFMLLFKLNILPYVCFPFYCHALSHLSLIETVMFTL